MDLYMGLGLKHTLTSALVYFCADTISNQDIHTASAYC